MKAKDTIVNHDEILSTQEENSYKQHEQETLEAQNETIPNILDNSPQITQKSESNELTSQDSNQNNQLINKTDIKVIEPNDPQPVESPNPDNQTDQSSDNQDTPIAASQNNLGKEESIMRFGVAIWILLISWGLFEMKG